MGTKVFLDTNIVLDIMDDKRPFHSAAIELFQLIEANEVDAFISESVLTTVDYILQKTTTKTTRVALLSDLLDILEVLPCTTQVCRKAINTNFYDLEDSVLYQVATEHSVDYFITNDKLALKKLSLPALPVISTKALLNIV